MIVTVATFSLFQAREYLGHRWPERHPFADRRRAWIGFDLLGYERSPLRDCLTDVSGPLVLSMADWDPECPQRGHHGTGADGPAIEHARAIVRHIVALHDDPEEYALAVHCHAGLFRSGAVAEWVRVDLGAEEHACSNRLVDVIGGGVWTGERTFNVTLLRLIREAHAETTR